MCHGNPIEVILSQAWESYIMGLPAIGNYYINFKLLTCHVPCIIYRICLKETVNFGHSCPAVSSVTI